MTIDGLIAVGSSFGHGETLARFEAAVRANGLRIVQAPIMQSPHAKLAFRSTQRRSREKGRVAAVTA